jgi:membrane protein involved in colicin uptake
MKYQLTLQKELNVKYQQEKQWKAQQHAHQKAEELRKAKEEAKVKEQQASAKTQDYFDDEESVTTQTKFFIFASNLKVSFLPQKFPIPKS